MDTRTAVWVSTAEKIVLRETQVAILRGWYRAQRPLNPENTKKWKNTKSPIPRLPPKKTKNTKMARKTQEFSRKFGWSERRLCIKAWFLAQKGAREWTAEEGLGQRREGKAFTDSCSFLLRVQLFLLTVRWPEKITSRDGCLLPMDVSAYN